MEYGIDRWYLGAAFHMAMFLEWFMLAIGRSSMPKWRTSLPCLSAPQRVRRYRFHLIFIYIPSFTLYQSRLIGSTSSESAQRRRRTVVLRRWVQRMNGLPARCHHGPCTGCLHCFCAFICVRRSTERSLISSVLCRILFNIQHRTAPYLLCTNLALQYSTVQYSSSSGELPSKYG